MIRFESSFCLYDYHWERCDGEEIDEEYFDALEEDGDERIKHCFLEGYFTGELMTNIRLNDDCNEDGVSFYGRFYPGANKELDLLNRIIKDRDEEIKKLRENSGENE